MSDEDGYGLKKTVAEFLGPGARELGELAADHIRYYRWKSAVSIVQKAKRWATEKGIKPDNIPLKFLLPFLERCSVESVDSDMADRWSMLLVNAACHYHSKFEIYSSLLATITADEARLLRRMYYSSDEHSANHTDNIFRQYHRDGKFLKPSKFLSVQEAHDHFDAPGRVVFVFWGGDIPNTNEFPMGLFEDVKMLMHLESLNLVSNEVESFLIEHERSFAFCGNITPLGYDLVACCEIDRE